jgi:hypothetical protein
MTTDTRLRLEASIPAWRPRSKQYGLNSGVNRWARHKATKVAHKKVEDALLVAGWPHQLPTGRRFILTFRVDQPAGKLMDDDNLAGCCKQLRDQVAKWLRTHDGPSGPITWRYRSGRGPVDQVTMILQEAE